jgi:maltose alpha-D-glucosyltransferase/alpha-amylase
VPGADGIELLVAQLDFADQSRSYYFLPWDPASEDEAVALPAFTSWLVSSIAGNATMPVGTAWTRLSAADLSGLGQLPGRVLGVEQSNTSIRYRQDLLIKVQRRLAIGPSPEAELSAVIAKARDASFAAATHGLLNLTGVGESPMCLAICAQFVPNVGDAWGYLLSKVTDPSDRDRSVGAEIEAIAAVTAAMHIGLTSDPWRREVAPEPITRDRIESWVRSAEQSLDELIADLGQSRAGLSDDAQHLVELLPDAVPVLRQQLQNMHATFGTERIRVHGDYHLGQLLRTADGRYVAVDFDGEPNRPLAERRDKYSALRDVAGMTRSLAYLRGTAERADERGRNAEWRAWERNLRNTYLMHYRARIADAPVRLVPESEEDLRLGVGALEMEKAIYECGYELSNRPDWLWLPLSRLVGAG